MLRQFWASHRPGFHVGPWMDRYGASCSTLGKPARACHLRATKFAEVILLIQAFNRSRRFLALVAAIWITWIFDVFLEAILLRPSEGATSFLILGTAVVVQLVLDGPPQVYLVREIVFDLTHVILGYAMCILGMLGSCSPSGSVSRLVCTLARCRWVLRRRKALL